MPNTNGIQEVLIQLYQPLVIDGEEEEGVDGGKEKRKQLV